jgi:nicotinamide mononucleotide transporter
VIGDGLLEKLLAGLRATSPVEAASVVLGIGYVVLAVRRQRLCWVFGGLSSALLVYLYARSRLPMQALLNLYYVAMSFYGYVQWTRSPSAAASPGVGTLALRFHVLAWLVIPLGAFLTARWLAVETAAAWPFLDALTTWASLFTTWLTARARLENWLYWIVIDALVAAMSAAQGLVFVALLFVLYLGVAVVGFLAWWREYRAAPAPALGAA